MLSVFSMSLAVLYLCIIWDHTYEYWGRVCLLWVYVVIEHMVNSKWFQISTSWTRKWPEHTLAPICLVWSPVSPLFFTLSDVHSYVWQGKNSGLTGDIRPVKLDHLTARRRFIRSMAYPYISLYRREFKQANLFRRICLRFKFNLLLVKYFPFYSKQTQSCLIVIQGRLLNYFDWQKLQVVVSLFVKISKYSRGEVSERNFHLQVLGRDRLHFDQNFKFHWNLSPSPNPHAPTPNQ